MRICALAVLGRCLRAVIWLGLFALCTPDLSSARETGVVDGTGFSSPCEVGFEAAKGCAEVRARTVLDASLAPWRSIGRVNYAGIDIRSHCTGTLIGEHLVLTAAHCLYNAPRERWIPASRLRFVAGYQRGAYEGLSKVARYVLAPELKDKPARARPHPSHDWAVLLLEHPLGARLGTVPIIDQTPSDAILALAGYPALRPHVMSLDPDCGPNRTDRAAGVLVQRCAVMSGDSGAPLLIKMPTGYAVLGILSGIEGGAEGAYSISVPSTAFSDTIERLRTPE